MSLRAVPLAAWVLAAVLVGVRSFGDEVAGARLELVWASPAGSWALPARLARKEVERRFESIGIEVSWRQAPGGGELRESELAVVLLTDPELEHALPESVMGAAPTAARTPVVVAFGTSLLRTMGWEGRVPSSLAANETLELGLALGRVISHELLHVLVPGRDHAELGLMHSRLTRSRLVLADLALTPEFTSDLLYAVERRDPIRTDPSR
jgi:hypothetical protein